MTSDLAWPLQRERTAVARARGLVTEHIDGPELRALAGLLVSETVTNAVLYGLDPVELRILRKDTVLRVEVSDGDVQPPPGAGRSAFTADAVARWLLVDSMADRWGVDLTDDRRLVWFEVDADRSSESR